jgi:hypothetical protein
LQERADNPFAGFEIQSSDRRMPSKVIPITAGRNKKTDGNLESSRLGRIMPRFRNGPFKEFLAAFMQPPEFLCEF